MAIADYERELDGADALLGGHHLCDIRHAEIQCSVRADRQQHHGDRTANGCKQVASDVELRHIHFVLHSIATASNNFRANSILKLESDTSIPKTAIPQTALAPQLQRRSLIDRF